MGYDGQNLVAEYNSSNVLQRRFVFGPGIDEPIVWYEGTGTSDRRWLHADERGSIVGASDGSGAALAYMSYDDYGIPQYGGYAGVVYGRFGYTGQVWLPELGLQHSRARTYSPTLGRFLQTDPIGFAGGVNLYAYVGNDPVNWRDPLGLAPDENEPPKPPACVNECPGQTVVVTGIPLPDIQRVPFSDLTQVTYTSTGIASNESAMGGGSENQPRRRRPRPQTPTPECRAMATAMLSYFIVGYTALEGVEAAEALVGIRTTAAGAEAGGALGSRAGWIGAAIGAITAGAAVYYLPALREAVVRELCTR